MRTGVLLAAAAVAVSLLDAPQPWRVLTVAAFVLVGPGLAALPWLPGTDRLTRAAAVVGVSLALTTVLAEALAIARIFSATAVVLALAAVSLTGSLVRPGALP